MNKAFKVNVVYTTKAGGIEREVVPISAPSREEAIKEAKVWVKETKSVSEILACNAKEDTDVDELLTKGKRKSTHITIVQDGETVFDKDIETVVLIASSPDKEDSERHDEFQLIYGKPEQVFMLHTRLQENVQKTVLKGMLKRLNDSNEDMPLAKALSELTKTVLEKL